MLAFACRRMLASDAKSILCRQGWLSQQPKAFQRRWLACGELRHHRAGTVLYAEGDPPGDLCGLVQGDLAVAYAAKSRESVLLHIAQPGWWAGDAAAISDGPRRVTVATRTDSWVMHVRLPDILAMAAEDSEVWRRIAQISVGHADHAMSIVASLTVADTRTRVAMALHRLLAFSEGKGPTGLPNVRVTQVELGSMTGISRNAIAPLLMDLEKSGLICRRYRCIEIVNLRGLSALVGQVRPPRIHGRSS